MNSSSGVAPPDGICTSCCFCKDKFSLNPPTEIDGNKRNIAGSITNFNKTNPKPANNIIWTTALSKNL